jgi:hypothetical protein
MCKDKSVLKIYNPNDLLNEILKFKFYLFVKCIKDTPKYENKKEFNSKRSVAEINNELLTSKFPFPIKRGVPLIPGFDTDTPNNYSVGSMFFPRCNSTTEFAEKFQACLTKYKNGEKNA